MKKELIKTEADLQFQKKKEELKANIKEWRSVIASLKEEHEKEGDLFHQAFTELEKKIHEAHEAGTEAEDDLIKEIKAREEDHLQKMKEAEAKINFNEANIKAAEAEIKKANKNLLNNLVANNKEFFINTPSHFKKFKDALNIAYPNINIYGYDYSLHAADRCIYGGSDNSTEADLYIYKTKDHCWNIYEADAEAIQKLENKTASDIRSNKAEIEAATEAALQDQQKMKELKEAYKKAYDEISSKNSIYSFLYRDYYFI